LRAHNLFKIQPQSKSNGQQQLAVNTHRSSLAVFLRSLLSPKTAFSTEEMLRLTISRWVSSFVVVVTGTLLATKAATSSAVTGFEVDVLENSPLPLPLSDMTAVVDSDSGKVYIHGGCDAADGNVYDAITGEFMCNSTSLTSLVFDIKSLEFTSKAAMPIARYRHAAVLVNNQVWLVGGRHVNDSLIGDVDVSATVPTSEFQLQHESYATSDRMAHF
jgi:hypothetical protein